MPASEIYVPPHRQKLLPTTVKGSAVLPGFEKYMYSLTDINSSPGS